MHESQKRKGNNESLKILRERELGKLYTLICTLYSMQLRKMAEQKLAPLWHLVQIASSPHLRTASISV